jgi:endonuclease/exonuclease/phosphatase family metal-dependent hydrolase
VEFTVAAFNAHWGVGRFGRFRGLRFDAVEVVAGLDADLVVVPESFRDDDGRGMLDPLCECGYRVETLHMSRLEDRKWGWRAKHDAVPHTGIWELAVCSRFPVLARRTYPMGTVRGDPAGPRRALSLKVSLGETQFEIIGVHTSSKLWQLAPVQHLRTLRDHIPEGGPQVLAGDFNFWGPAVSVGLRGWHRPVRGRTYPSKSPHSQIDHVLVRGGIDPIAGEVLAETPSDHRPIRARLRLAQTRG